MPVIAMPMQTKVHKREASFLQVVQGRGIVKNPRRQPSQIVVVDGAAEFPGGRDKTGLEETCVDKQMLLHSSGRRCVRPLALGAPLWPRNAPGKASWQNEALVTKLFSIKQQPHKQPCRYRQNRFWAASVGTSNPVGHRVVTYRATIGAYELHVL